MKANKMSSLYDWLYKNRWAIIVPTVIGLAVHFQMYSNVPFNPDSSGSWGVFRPGAWELSLGRWGWQYVMALRGYLVSPIFAAIFLSLFYSLAGNLLAEIFEVEGALRIALPLTIVCSTMAAGTMSNYYCADTFALSYLLACASAVCVVKIKNSVLGVLAGALMLAFSLGIYQSNIGVAAVICVMVIFLQCIFTERDVKSILLQAKNFLLMGICGVACYLLILKIQLWVNGVALSNYRGANGVSIGSIIKNFRQAIYNTYSDFFTYFFEDTIVFHFNSFGIKQINMLLFFVFLLALGYTVYRAAKAKRIIQSCIALFCVAIMPITANLIEVMVPGTRISDTILVVGGVCTIPGFLVTVLWRASRNPGHARNLLRGVAFVLSVSLAWGYSLQDNANAIAMQMDNNRTIELAGRICQSMEESGYRVGDKALIIGVPNSGNYPAIYPMAERVGYSFTGEMVWSAGSWYNWATILYREYGLNIYQGLDSAYAVEASEEFKAMPLYPEKGSIQKINDVYVVKVSN